VGQIPVANPSPILRWTFPRRGLAIAFVLVAMVVLAGVALATTYPTHPEAQSQLIGPHWVTALRASKMESDQPIHIFEYKLWLVKTRSGEIFALSHKEPNRGCTIPWRPDFTFDGHKGWFRDPCSGSTFDMTGVKAFGPSPRGMDRYETRVVNGDIQVHIGKGVALESPDPDSKLYFSGQ
jgi:Rieske Fe-S protein